MDRTDSIFGATPADGAIAHQAEAASSLPPAPAPSAEESRAQTAEGAPTTPMSEFALRVMTMFRTAYDHREESGVSERLRYCLRAYRQRFSDKQLMKLREMFPDTDIPERLFSPITSVKIRTLRAILVDLVNQAGEPLFHLEASPVPDVGDDLRAKAFNEHLVEIASMLADFDREGSEGKMPPEAVARLRVLVGETAERRYDDIANTEEGEARDRVRRMEKKVWDIIVEGGGEREFISALDNLCVFGVGVVRGPVMQNVARNAVKEKDGVKTYRREVVCIPVFESVNPLDCYPAPGAVEVEDGPLCITVKFTGEELFRLARSAENGEKPEGGWMGTVVNDILGRHAEGGVKLNALRFDPLRRQCEDNGFDESSDRTFEGVRCFAPMRGSELAGIGITKDLDGEKIDRLKWYRTESVVIDNRVVYICIHADEVGVPVSKACCYGVPGSWWGESIADKVAQCQCVLNNTAKSIIVNQSMTSSPQGYVSDVSRLTDKSPEALKWRPGKIWGFAPPSGFGPVANSGKPMDVFAIPSTLNDSIATWREFQKQADLDSGLPAYSEGQAAGASGAMRTAQGLNTFVENTMRGCKSIMTNVDKGLISRVARLTADWVLVYDDDQSLKGDVFVRSVGLIGRILKVQRDAARLQLLNLCLNSQMLTQTIGVKGIIELFRPSLVDLDINPDDIIPSKARIKEQDAIMQIAQIVKSVGGMSGGGEDEPAPAGMQSGVAPVQQNQELVQPGTVAERRGAA